MRRRDALIGGSLSLSAIAGGPRWASAAGSRTAVIGWLGAAGRSATDEYVSGFVAALEKLGRVRDRDISLVIRSTEGLNEKLASVARELVELKPDLIVAEGTRGALAASAASSTIPIVAPAMGESTAVRAAGPSFNQPLANVTGITVSRAMTVAKLLEIAGEIRPTLRRAGLLVEAAVAETVAKQIAEWSAGRPDLSLVTSLVNSAGDLAGAIARLRDAEVDVIVVPTGTIFFSDRRRLVELANATKLPVVYGVLSAVSEGGLIGYGVDSRANFRRAAVLVDKILSGQRPKDIPIEQGELRLAVNLKTARMLGLSLPAALLGRADEIVDD